MSRLRKARDTLMLRVRPFYHPLRNRLSREIDLAALRRRRPARHVLIATNGLDRSGAPKLAVEMAAIYRAEDVEVTVVAPRGGTFHADLKSIGVRVIIDNQLGKCPSYLRELARLSNFAICNTAVIWQIVEVISSAVRTVWYVHEISQTEALNAQGCIAAPLASVEAVWAGSELCARLLRPLRDDVAVVPYGLSSIGRCHDGRPADEPFQIGVFGTIEPRKGQDFVVDAVASLDDSLRRKLRVYIFGKMNDPTFAPQVIARANADPIIEYCGELDGATYATAMLQMDAVLVCSRDDTLPLVSLDALGAGQMLLLVPSVGTTAWISDGMDALVGREASRSGVRELIVRAIEMRSERERIGEAARATFARHFAKEMFRDRLISQLKSAPPA